MIILAENPSLAAKHTKVCDICGAIQAVNDTEKRNQTHLEGKVHTGFALLRKELDKLIKQKEIHKLYQEVSRKEERKAREGGKREKSRDCDSRDSTRKREHKKKHHKRDSDGERQRKSRHHGHKRSRRDSGSATRSPSRSKSRDRKRSHRRH